MRQPEILTVDPKTLHVRPAQASGADPFKLQTQIARFGASTDGMPLPWVYRGSDGALVLYQWSYAGDPNRQTRARNLDPGRGRG